MIIHKIPEGRGYELIPLVFFNAIITNSRSLLTFLLSWQAVYMISWEFGLLFSCLCRQYISLSWNLAYILLALKPTKNEK